MNAKNALEMADEYPYDGSRDGDWADRAARGVITDLRGRQGFHVFSDIDDEIRKDIVHDLAEIIREACAIKRKSKEPVLFYIRFLEATFGNSKGETVGVREESDGEVYYYDSYHRYVYLTKAEEGKTWERVKKEKK